jgi:hypothetical protein
MTRSNAQVNVSDTNSIGGRTVEALNAMGRNGVEILKIGALRGDVVGGT